MYYKNIKLFYLLKIFLQLRILEKHEKEKMRQYNSRIMNIEHGTSNPIGFLS